MADHVRQDNRVVHPFRSGATMDLLTAYTNDRVDELLAALNINSTVYCLSDLYAPWGFRVDGRAAVTFHLVLDGSCWLRIDGADPVHLDEGDLVMLPRGDGHAVTDDIDTPVRDLDRILADHPLDAAGRLAYGGDGNRTELLCGGFVLTQPRRNAVRAFLPNLVRLNAARSVVAPWLEPTFALLRHEAQYS